MTTGDESRQAFETALAVARARLDAKRDEMRQLSAEMNALSLTIRGLQEVLGIEPDPTDAAVEKIFHSTRRIREFRRLQEQLNESAHAQDSLNVVARQTPTITAKASVNLGGLTAGSFPITSTERAVAIICEMGKPMMIADVVTEFENRGWIEPAWTNAQAAIGQAVRRAADQGLITRLDRRFYGPPVTPEQPADDGGDPYDDGEG